MERGWAPGSPGLPYPQLSGSAIAPFLPGGSLGTPSLHLSSSPQLSQSERLCFCYLSVTVPDSKNILAQRHDSKSEDSSALREKSNKNTLRRS